MQAFTTFFVASSGAAAALLGLLFVAVSISPERTVARDAPMARQALAASTFSAMLNAFFISLIALLPNSRPDSASNAGIGAAILGTLGLLNSLRLAWMLLKGALKEWRGWKSLVRRAFLVVAAGVIYGYELYYGGRLIAQPTDIGALYTLAGLIVAVYGVGLTRAWELLGAQRFGITGWLSVLGNDEDESRPEPAVPATSSSRHTATPD
jgi:hypothetical protein